MSRYTYSINEVTIIAEDGRVTVSEPDLTLLSFEHPNAEGAAQTIYYLLQREGQRAAKAVQ